jgi:hypothetical protein
MWLIVAKRLPTPVSVIRFRAADDQPFESPSRIWPGIWLDAAPGKAMPFSTAMAKSGRLARADDVAGQPVAAQRVDVARDAAAGHQQIVHVGGHQAAQGDLVRPHAEAGRAGSPSGGDS